MAAFFPLATQASVSSPRYPLCSPWALCLGGEGDVGMSLLVSGWEAEALQAWELGALEQVRPGRWGHPGWPREPRAGPERRLLGQGLCGPVMVSVEP